MASLQTREHGRSFQADSGTELTSWQNQLPWNPSGSPHSGTDTTSACDISAFFKNMVELYLPKFDALHAADLRQLGLCVELLSGTVSRRADWHHRQCASVRIDSLSVAFARMIPRDRIWIHGSWFNAEHILITNCSY